MKEWSRRTPLFWARFGPPVPDRTSYVVSLERLQRPALIPKISQFPGKNRTYERDMARAQPGKRTIHVAHDDRNVLKPQIVAASVCGNRPAAGWCWVLQQPNVLAAQRELRATYARSLEACAAYPPPQTLQTHRQRQSPAPRRTRESVRCRSPRVRRHRSCLLRNCAWRRGSWLRGRGPRGGPRRRAR